MDLPFCKICGERHRLGFCPEYGPTGIVEPPEVVVRPKPAVKPAAPVIAPVPVVEEAPPPASGFDKPKRFDKKSYQRELMRKRRAAAREARQRDQTVLGLEALP